jgi:putative transposase
MELPLGNPTRGGARKGAGRKPGAGRHRVEHSRRSTHDRHCPVHVTLRVRNGVPSLRSDSVFGAVATAFAAGSSEQFRLLQFSVQHDHVHLIVEADDAQRLIRGIQGLAIRVARAVNRVLGRRGALWGDRYHSRQLQSPREVRNAIVYVLANFKKHLCSSTGIDPRSSALWFDGFRRVVRLTEKTSPVAAARTWLMRRGWRRYGLIDIQEAPRRS